MEDGQVLEKENGMERWNRGKWKERRDGKGTADMRGEVNNSAKIGVVEKRGGVRKETK